MSSNEEEKKYQKTEAEGTLIWYIKTEPGKIVEFSAPFSQSVFASKKCISEKELELLKYTVLSRLNHLLRCVSGYYEMLTSIGDALGIALFGMAHGDPLQFIKFDYDNFSGFERLSVPYMSYSKALPNTVAKISAKQIKIADFFAGPVGCRGSSKDIQRLFTGLCKSENAVPRQKFMQVRESDNFRLRRGKPKKFLSWIGSVGNNMYREYRVDANLAYAPALSAVCSEQEASDLCKLVIEKRIKEVPHYKQHYSWLIKNMFDKKAHLICSMAVSPYMLLLQFEQNNFASNYDWIKPKSLSKFSKATEVISLIECELEELSTCHYPEVKRIDTNVEIQAKSIRNCVHSLENDIHSLLSYTILIIRYCSSTKSPSRLMTVPLQKAIDGLFYAISLTQYCEDLYAEYEIFPTHLLTLILHCLDPEKQLTIMESAFIKMFNFDTLWENSEVKIAIATNFFEFARRKSIDMKIAKNKQILYQKIYECLPKLGSVLWKHTKNIYDEISDAKIIESSRIVN